MKQKLVASTLITLLAVGAQPVIAEELGKAKTYKQEWQGMGIGALVGAIAGGPPGFIIGAAGGGLIGRHQGLEGDLHSAEKRITKLTSLQQGAETELKVTQQQITELRKNLSQSKSTLKTQAKALEVTNKQYEKQLDAIIQGFILNLQFRTESAELEPHFEQQLEQAITIMRAFPELSIHVHAHADHRGTDIFNQSLTQRRANSVVRRLRAAGIRAGRIHKRSLGDTMPGFPQGSAFTSAPLGKARHRIP